MSFSRIQTTATAIVIGVVAAISLLSLSGQGALGRTASAPDGDLSAHPVVEMPNPALQKIADRIGVSPADGTEPPASEEDLAELRRLYRSGELHSAADYYVAGCALSRSSKSGDVLLAHDLAMAALVMGDRRSVALMTTTEDRYLILTGQPQRFGTQRKISDGKSALDPVDGVITDRHRRDLDLRSLRDLRTSTAPHERFVRVASRVGVARLTFD